MGKLFGERELSKKDFERIDIDVRSMPKEIKEKLLNGELTPLVEIRDQLDNGIIATMPVKLRLQRDTDGNAVLKAYPVYNPQNEMFARFQTKSIFPQNEKSA